MFPDNDRLLDLLGRPSEAARPPAAPEGLVIPADYADLAARLGAGVIDDHLRITVPDCPNPSFDLRQHIDDWRRALVDFREFGVVPDDYCRPGHELLAFTSTTDGVNLYWMATDGEPPEQWTVVLSDAGMDDWQQFDLPTSECLVAILTGDLRVDMLDHWLPRERHEFVEFAMPAV